MFDCLPQIQWIATLWTSWKQESSESRAVDETSALLGNSSSPIQTLSTELLPERSIHTASDTAGQDFEGVQIAGENSSRFLFPPSRRKPASAKTNHEIESDVYFDEPASYPHSLTSTQYDAESSTSKRRSQNHSSLLNDLCESLIDWPIQGTRRFLPVDQFERLLTLESIRIELENVPVGSDIGIPKVQLVKEVSKRFRKILAILVLSGLTEFIYDFVKEDIHDEHLPFKMGSRRELFSKINPSYRVECTKDWTSSQFRRFDHEQWSLTAPIFRRTPDIEHYDIDRNQIMPFIFDASEVPTKMKRGGFGEVYKVVIHPAHQFLSGTTNPFKMLNPAFAIKRLFSGDRVEFEQEVEMLKFFGGDRHHSHLAELVATYEYRGHFHLIFPYAKCNLRTYWKKTPCPEFSQETVGWFLYQVKGLSSAVNKIHGYKKSVDVRDTKEPIGSLRSLDEQVVEAEPLYCCIHGDIKADNILWSDEDSRDEDHLLDFAGILILTDFGQMRNYKAQTELRKPLEVIAETPAYAPPEATNPVELPKPSRTYDIWGLGCVYLEFTIWLLCDWDALVKFTEARGATFYSKHKPESEQRHDEAVVNECVQRWITELHRKPRCSKFFHDFLRLISSMLDVTPSKRIRSGELNRELTSMLKKAKEEPEYLILPCPSHALCCCQNEHHHESMNENTRPCPKEGTPLPARPSVFQQIAPSDWARAKRSSDLWKVATKTSLFRAEGNSNPVVGRWMRTVSTFHKHDVI